MAHYAFIDDNNKVLRVLVVGDDQEHRGQDFLANDLNLGGTWIQCSYNNNIRNHFPTQNSTYDPVNDVFIKPSPYPSWSLNEDFVWVAPVSKPEDKDDGNWYWIEEEQQWRFVLDADIADFYAELSSSKEPTN